MERILVAYDGGAPARRALEMAIELATKFGARISVVSVAPGQSGTSPVDPRGDAPGANHELLDARTILLDHGIEADFLEPSGDPAEAIEEIAERGGFDTIVVGTRGLDPVSRLLQGSVSDQVSSHAEATIVIAR